MILIGLAGPARAGKNTVAEAMSGYLGPHVEMMAFADPLKNICVDLFDLTQEERYNESLKEKEISRWGLSPRQMYQSVGTAMRTQFGPGFWVRKWEIEYEKLPKNCAVIVTDVRFDNEAAAIRRKGGIIIKVERPAVLQGATAKHESENGLSTDPDFVILNDSTLDKLKSLAKLLAEELYGRI